MQHSMNFAYSPIFTPNGIQFSHFKILINFLIAFLLLVLGLMILIVSSALWTVLVLVDFDFPILMFFLTGLEGVIDVIRYYGICFYL